MSRANRLENQLKTVFEPELIEIHDESHMHAGQGLETHLKIVIVSDYFFGMTRVKRHQAVYAHVQDEMTTGLHALALHLFTSDEWDIVQAAPSSPNCRGRRV